MRLQRPPLKLLFPILAISILATVSYAVSVTVTNNNYQSQNGVYYNVGTFWTAASNGFVVVSTTGAASTQPCPWVASGTCQTALTAGNWEFSVTLTINAGAATSTTYTMTVKWNPSGSYVTLGTLTVTSPASITAGQTMTFLFDTGLTTITAPAGITVTLA